MTQALSDIAAERERQKTQEGWSDTHDDGHKEGQLGLAAACYALSGSENDVQRAALAATYKVYGSDAVSAWRRMWRWSVKHWKPKDRRRDLVRAGALIVAEIERLDRAAAKVTAP